jgi:hypothetical protein
MSDIHALSGAYAVDAVDDLERASFERHLATCADCQAEVASVREATAALADDVQAAPPPELREQVLDAITRVRPLPPVAEDQAVHRQEAPVIRRRWFPALVAAVVLGIIGAGATVWQPWQDDTSTTLSATDRVLQAPDAERFSQTLTNGATATVVRSASEHRAVLVTEDMPAAPDTYPERSMVSAISQAAQGLDAGSDRVSQAADRIARNGMDDDLAGNMVNMLEARRHVRANVAVVRTADEMIGTLLDVLA